MKILAPLLLSLALAAPAAQAASYTYVGSWQVDAGPDWLEMPPAYSGQAAAALLFGGKPSDYAISTVSTLVAEIDFRAWYSILGVGGTGHALAQDLDQALAGGFYYDDTPYEYGNLGNPASAYVWDNALGAGYTNHAFRIAAVPLPAGGLLLAGALGALGLLCRRRARPASVSRAKRHAS